MRSLGVITKDRSKQLQSALIAFLGVTESLNCLHYLESKWKGVLPPRFNKVVRFVPYHQLIKAAEVIFAFGGDGTIVRIGHDLQGKQTPIVGVNFGRLGYLCNYLFDNEFLSRLPMLVGNKNVNVEKRNLIQYVVIHNGKKKPGYAVNEVIINSSAANLIHIDCSMNNLPLTRFLADGVILATPTGSTAYALSAGGPIVDSSVESLIMVPICPHILSNRSVVCGKDSIIQLRLNDETRGMVSVSYDGINLGRFRKGDVLEVRLSKKQFLLVVNPESNFFHRLNQKLKWNVR